MFLCQANNLLSGWVEKEDEDAAGKHEWVSAVDLGIRVRYCEKAHRAGNEWEDRETENKNTRLEEAKASR